MWYRRDFSRETMRDFSLARSLVSQGWSREKSRSRENPIDTLRDPTLLSRGEETRLFCLRQVKKVCFTLPTMIYPMYLLS